MILYHGSNQIVQEPRVDRNTKHGKDFGPGFYCTTIENQAVAWSYRRTGTPTLNVYEYTECKDLNIKVFRKPNREWLNFVVDCRSVNYLTHDYDIVIGPVSDDKLWRDLTRYQLGEISAKEMLKKARANRHTNQVVFCSNRALDYLEFRGCEYV